MDNEVEFIQGDISIDERGQLVFCNKFNMENIKRFYLVCNHQAKFIRAWHAHKREDKYVLVVSGAAIIAAVKIDDWDKPSKNLPVRRYVLSEKQPGILHIPAGYANGFMSLVPGAQVMFFSTATLEESKSDDFRYDAFYWDPWDIIQR